MKWTLRISSGYNDGKKAIRNPIKTEKYEGNIDDVVKQIKEKHFTEGDETGTLDSFGTTIKTWTLIRKLNYGEYRAILRLRPYDEVLDEDK